MNSNGKACPFERHILENALDELANSFSIEWLNSESNHPLQKLWKRDDYLASLELANLGCSISKAKMINSEFAMKHINRIKNENPDLRRGSIYEIIFAAAFHIPPKQVVEMLHPQAPTYDLIVHFQDNSIINISVKNFGDSEQSSMFITESKKIESKLEKIVRNPTQIVISNDVYPSKMDWDNLGRNLPKILHNFKDVNIGGWRVSLFPLNSGKKKFYSPKASYTIHITTQFYHNEESRIYKSLKKACSDIEEKGTKETDKIMNILCIHIPSHVRMEDYIIWCENYLKNNPGTQISGMRLIQPALAVDSQKDKSFLAFSYRDIFRPEKLENWFGEKDKQLNGEFVVGVPSTEPLNVIFNPEEHNIPRRHYMYQSGHIYHFCEKTEEGSLIAEPRFDYGIHTHAVINLFKQDTIWSGKFPPTNELLIL